MSPYAAYPPESFENYSMSSAGPSSSSTSLASRYAPKCPTISRDPSQTDLAPHQASIRPSIAHTNSDSSATPPTPRSSPGTHFLGRLRRSISSESVSVSVTKARRVEHIKRCLGRHSIAFPPSFDYEASAPVPTKEPPEAGCVTCSYPRGCLKERSSISSGSRSQKRRSVSSTSSSDSDESRWSLFTRTSNGSSNISSSSASESKKSVAFCVFTEVRLIPPVRRDPEEMEAHEVRKVRREYRKEVRSQERRAQMQAPKQPQNIAARVLKRWAEALRANSSYESVYQRSPTTYDAGYNFNSSHDELEEMLFDDL